MPLPAALLMGKGIWRWIHRLGGPGLILLGLVDNSAVPIPGGMDVFVILLSAHRPEWWFYYGLMATLGGLLGGYLTYRLARKGGKEAIERRFGQRRSRKVYQRFEKHGFSTVVVGAILPPPFPIVPVLMAAGALQYPRKKFLFALALGRGLRYFAIAFLGRMYGTTLIDWFGRYHQPLLYGLIGMAIAAGIAALVYFKWYLPRRHAAARKPAQNYAGARDRNRTGTSR